MSHIDPAVQRDLVRFEEMCEMVGPQATEEQTQRLISWACEKFGTDMYGAVGNIGVCAGIPEIYTEFSMRQGECGR